MSESVLLSVSSGWDALWFLVLGVELVWVFLRGGFSWARLREVGGNVSAFVATVATAVLAASAVTTLMLSAGALVPWSVPVTPQSAVLALVLVDFVYYWEHRMGHEVRAWWAASHAIHHSSDHYDATTALRLGFLDVFISPLTLLPLVFVGFHPLLLMAASTLVVAYQGWIHTEMVGRLGWLDAVFNTPSNHRVHHGSDPEYLDKNYGGILMVWDHLFGTYQQELHTPTYGLTVPLPARDPWTVHTAEIGRVWREARDMPLGEALRHLFMPRSLQISTSSAPDAAVTSTTTARTVPPPTPATPTSQPTGWGHDHRRS